MTLFFNHPIRKHRIENTASTGKDIFVSFDNFPLSPDPKRDITEKMIVPHVSVTFDDRFRRLPVIFACIHVVCHSKYTVPKTIKTPLDAFAAHVFHRGVNWSFITNIPLATQLNPMM